MGSFYDELFFGTLINDDNFDKIISDLKDLYKEKSTTKLIKKLKNTEIYMKRLLGSTKEYILKYKYGKAKSCVIRINNKTDVEVMLSLSDIVFLNPVDTGVLYKDSYLVKDTKTNHYGVYSLSSYMFLASPIYDTVTQELLARIGKKWGSIIDNYIPLEYDGISIINNKKEDILKTDMYVVRKDERYGLFIFYRENNLIRKEIKLPVLFDDISLLCPLYNKDIILMLTYLGNSGVYSIKENRWLMPPILDRVVEYNPSTKVLKCILNGREEQIDTTLYNQTEIEKNVNKLIKKL